ncbi:MAG: DUF2382 domain-containing protein [Chloroflexaceae bacterium]|jgi:uncharacterized protein (TIGR02271 family)|nr:DUF2382 domain-containing protein [Chloroflexaceae bacterium]
MKTVVGLFDDRAEAQRAVDDLKSNGFDNNEISFTSDASKGTKLVDQMAEDVPASDMAFYREGLKHGGHLVIVRCADGRASEAARILSRYNIVHVDDRATQYRQSGAEVNLRDYNQDDYVIPVVEEELQVGKREVERGRLRVYSRVVEQPVEQQVSLREETVHVERRPVNRPVSQAELDAALKEQKFEISERDEEAVVAKTARVIEEVHVGKQVSERTETVRDTVRRTDVEVDQSSSGTVGAASTGSMSGSDFSSYDSDFRSYFTTNYASSGYSYDEYSPVFRYGHSLASSDRYRGKDWSVIESDARRDWETHNPGTWEQFKDSVRYAWDKARGKK